MTLISESITDLFGGVSQAPSPQRLPNQFTDQVNALPIYGKRLGRRPPGLHVAKLATPTSLDPAGTLVYPVVTSSGLRVHLIVTKDGLQAYDATTGASIPVVAPAGVPYVVGNSTPLRAVSSGDTTIILNQDAVVAKDVTVVAPATKYEALLCVRQGDYSCHFTVTIGGVPFLYTTPDATATGALAATATDAIAASLQALIQARLGASYWVVTYGSSIYVTRKDGLDFQVSSSDGLADKGILVIKDRVQRFSDLPERARPGITVAVTGEDFTVPPYYVQYTSNTNPGGPGVWKEVVKPGSYVALDKTTLPVRCVFRGSLVSETPHVGSDQLLPELYSFYPDAKWSLTFPADRRYPANHIVTVNTDLGPSFSYTTGASPETAAQVAVGLQAVIDADAAWTASITGPEQVTMINDAATAFTPFLSIGPDPTTTFKTLQVLPTGLEGYTIKNLTDGSSGVILTSTANSLSVGSLLNGRTNRFNDGDVCVVVSTGDYFVFGTGPWADRSAGDETTVPFPSIVGKSLNEVFFHQGRLGLVASSNVVLSRPGKPFSLSRSYATQVVSDDPIDFTNATGDASPFHAAIEWNGALYIFSGQQQYALSGASGVLTPETVQLLPTSRYVSDPRVRPVVAGNRLYFVAMKSGHPRVMEYRIKGYERLHDAVDTGLHLPTYLVGNPLSLAVDDTQGILLFLTDGQARKSLYVYTYRMDNGEKVSAGWGRWDFSGGTIVGLDCVNGTVETVRAFNDGTYLERLLLDPVALASYDNYFDGSRLFDGSFVFGQGNPIGGERVAYLDRRLSSYDTGLSVAYSGGFTTWTLPYGVAVDGSEGILTVAIQQGSQVLTSTTRPAANQIQVAGDYSTTPVYIGVRYTTLWSFSTLYVRSKDGEADLRGRLQLRFLRLRYSDSSDLTATVTVQGRSPTTYTLNSTVPASGTFLVPLQGRNEEVSVVVSNSTPGAGHLISYDWEGTQHTRERAL